ncbi:MAG: flagellar basal body P-ring protein FlgI [Bacillota bacterium]
MSWKFTKIYYIIFIVFLLMTLSVVPGMAEEMEKEMKNDPVVEIGDITRLQGVRTNQLSGYGLVVGLAGTGDSRSQIRDQSMSNVLERHGLDISSEEVNSSNVAAVMVTAELPAFARNGDNIDVQISSIGDAESLDGGTLLSTELRAHNDDVYAVAQGPVATGGFSVEEGGSSVRENHTTVAEVPNGALVEREVEMRLDDRRLSLLLDESSMENAQMVSETINDQFREDNNESKVARPVDGKEIRVEVPDKYRNNVVEYVSEVNALEVRPSIEPRVVVSERTGTVVFTHNVRISTVAVSHGNLTVTVNTSEEVSQPPAFSEGETEETEETEIEVERGEGHMEVVEGRGTISDLVNALNTIGASPDDIITIMREIKSSGALHAELKIS